MTEDFFQQAVVEISSATPSDIANIRRRVSEVINPQTGMPAIGIVGQQDYLSGNTSLVLHSEPDYAGNFASGLVENGTAVRASVTLLPKNPTQQ